MVQISFGSTYKIPVNQIGVNNSSKTQFKSIIDSYSGTIIGKGKDQYALLSIPDKKDNSFFLKIRKLGYFQIRRFEGEKISKEKLKAYVEMMIQNLSK